MKVINLLIALALFTLFSGCAGVTVSAPNDYDSSQVNSVQTKAEWLQLPQLSSRHTVRLGDSLVSTSRMFGNPEISLISPISIRAESAKAVEMNAICKVNSLPVGRYIAFLESPSTLYYSLVTKDTGEVLNASQIMRQKTECAEGSGKYGLVGLSKDKRTGVVLPWVSMIWNSQGPELNGSQYKAQFVTAINDDNFKQELYFNGKSGNTLKFMYREFSGKMLRGSFSQEIVYDLSEGNEIGFKNALIRVISTSNTQITYEVLKHFDPVN